VEDEAADMTSLRLKKVEKEVEEILDGHLEFDIKMSISGDGNNL